MGGGNQPLQPQEQPFGHEHPPPCPQLQFFFTMGGT
ncbi:hypothetical protein FHX41_4441 [Actinomadura hallensis]|uniref:Uncharacterized protein n=1 Tax=Actinomadura hallensis TaxID=337895 RepID=A0A543IJF9_9ACTN|nr:hypothetical protein FHX41_4441 [Actinomadura hallensis]